MKQRIFGLDLVRIIAYVLLLWLHFYLKNNFYYCSADSPYMIIASAGRVIFMCCIPLFLMLTGYLKGEKRPDLKNILSLAPIIISWIIISALHLVDKVFIRNEVHTPYKWACEFLDYNLANYSWYIEMYIGIAILCPFLNIIWHKLSGKKEHHVLLSSMIFLTILPPTINIIAIDENYLNIVPNYWTSLYYFTYYFIGCYIRTYKPKVNKIFSLSCIMMLSLAVSIINKITRTNPDKYYSGFNINYNHLITAVISILIFLCAYDVQCKKQAVAKLFSLISCVVLELYLISSIVDTRIYKIDFGKYGANVYLARGFLYTFLVFIISFIPAVIIHFVSKKICSMLTPKSLTQHTAHN